MSNVINIIVNDRVKIGSIVPKPQLNLSFSIKDLKKLLKELFRITNDEIFFIVLF